MSTSLRITALFLAIATALLAVEGFVSVQQERADLLTDLFDRSAGIAATLSMAVAQDLSHRDRAAARLVLDEYNRSQNRTQSRLISMRDGADLSEQPSAGFDAEAIHSAGAMSILTGTPPSLLTWRRVPNDSEYVIELSERVDRLAQLTGRFAKRSAMLVLILAVLAGALSWPIGRRYIGRPLDSLVEQSRQLGAGDLSARVDLEGAGEFSKLARSFNEMAARIQDSQLRLERETSARLRVLEQLRHEDRLRTVGRLASGVAHELGTPLNVVSGRAQLIAGGRLAPDQVLESAAIIKRQSESMSSIIRQLLDFARKRQPRKSEVELTSHLESIVAMLRPFAEKTGCRIALDCDRNSVKAEVDSVQLEQVLVNLIVNGIQAMPNGGTVVVGVGREQRDPPPGVVAESGTFVVLSVSDEGKGIERDELSKIFEPFYTTKDVGEGTGLGLSIAHGIIAEHGGWIEAESEAGVGTRLTICLPEGPEVRPDTDAQPGAS